MQSNVPHKYAELEDRAEDLEDLIRDLRLGKKPTARGMDALRAATADLRARCNGQPGTTLVELQRRIADAAAVRTHNDSGWSPGHMVGIGEMVMGHWAVIRQALERLGGGGQLMTTPYATATSGASAREEITKVLRRFGCESIGFMDDFEKHEVLLAFSHRGRQVQLRASAKGWAQMYLKENPWSYRRRGSRHDWDAAALRQGQIATNSILRDWIKGQMTAVECGILSFEAVFMPHMLTADGRPLLDRLRENNLLPALPEPKAVGAA